MYINEINLFKIYYLFEFFYTIAVGNKFYERTVCPPYAVKSTFLIECRNYYYVLVAFRLDVEMYCIGEV